MIASMAILQEGARRLSNQLMIGHGAASLLLFNAATGRSDQTADLRPVAAVFALGLVMAFFMVFASFVHETTDKALTASETFEEDNYKNLDWWLSRIGYAFLLSASCFVLGLVVAIGMLGQP